MKDTDGVGAAFMEAVTKLSKRGSLDKKTHELAYISVLMTSKMYGGLPFHLEQAKNLGATFEEVKSAVLLPLPILGLQVAEALPYVYETFGKSEAVGALEV
jgi:alkylhydroperoxidase/carboxymuconolactone decarboxylase family protein YurZ